MSKSYLYGVDEDGEVHLLDHLFEVNDELFGEVGSGRNRVVYAVQRTFRTNGPILISDYTSDREGEDLDGEEFGVLELYRYPSEKGDPWFGDGCYEYVGREVLERRETR